MLAQLTLFLTLSTPEGFAPEDRFDSIEDACFTLSAELAPDKLQAQAFSWCKQRAWASTRGRRYKSRVDGSWIHDRDRPAAEAMYLWGWRIGRIDPANCEHDRIDAKARRPAKAKALANNWPFDNPLMTEAKRKRWMRSRYDMERFGTRGPIDNNMTIARGIFPGCWSPEALDRYDVAAAVTILRTVKICERHGCRNNRAIRAHW